MYKIGSDFGKGLQYELSLVKQRMGDCQIIGVQH
jgi:hypothetical protein